MVIKAVPLGAGQDVGRSCVLVTIGGKNVMFDCGMHMGYQDERRFPDFQFISRSNEFNKVIDCVIISHFHLDHCGALPYFTEVCGYDGPVYMTYPTKAIAPILLEDFRKITVDRKGETNFFSSEDLKNCMKKVTAVNLHQTIRVDDDLEIRAYYAGHVLGAAMFWVRCISTGESVVYTGDYNMTPDRHLGAAKIDKVRPDLLITETTYATTIRDSKRSREREFLEQVHKCVENGGKVLIPVFALGRAQELCILLETYWERMNLKVPIYFSAGLVEKANYYYKLYISWTNQKIKQTFVKRNMFDFNHIKAFDRSLTDQPGPMVLFATPGMLHAGMSLEVFKKWAPSEKNLVILPGYCVAGTVGNKLLKKRQGRLEVDKKTFIDVRCGVSHLSFSAHADAKGIIQLIRECEPKNIMMVHGEKAKMDFLKEKIIQDFKINCVNPANGSTVTIETFPPIRVDMSLNLLKNTLSEEHQATQTQPALQQNNDDSNTSQQQQQQPVPYNPPKKKRRVDAVLIMRPNERACLYEPEEAACELGLRQHKMKFSVTKYIINNASIASEQDANHRTLRQIHDLLSHSFNSEVVTMDTNSRTITLKSVTIAKKLLNPESDMDQTEKFQISWSLEDEAIAEAVISLIDVYANSQEMMVDSDTTYNNSSSNSNTETTAAVVM